MYGLRGKIRGNQVAEYVGTTLQVSIQKRMRERHVWIEDTPEIANGGRTLNFLDPDKMGWSRVGDLTQEDGVAVFMALPLEETRVNLQERLGANWRTPHWDVFFGNAEPVLEACNSVMSSFALPVGWRIDSLDTPTERQIDDIQNLNIVVGIAPYPAYYCRGDVVPCVSTCIWDDKGQLVATAMANYRYHPNSRLKGHLYAGSVSVLPDCQGMGLGKMANAALLVHSHRIVGWATALEQVKPDNVPSRRMIEACGLTKSQELATIFAINSDDQFSV